MLATAMSVLATIGAAAISRPGLTPCGTEVPCRPFASAHEERCAEHVTIDCGLSETTTMGMGWRFACWTS